MCEQFLIQSVHTPINLYDGILYRPALTLFRHVYSQRAIYHAMLTNKIQEWDITRFADELHAYFMQYVRVSPNGGPNLNYELCNYVETFRYLTCLIFRKKKNKTEKTDLF